MANSADPLDEDEILYRRVLEEHYDSEVDNCPSHKAFAPRRHDDTGLSMFRTKYRSAEEIASMSGRREFYFVASFRYGDLVDEGIEVIAAASEEEPGHVELPALRYERKRECGELQVLLAEKLCIEVLGPLNSA